MSDPARLTVDGRELRVARPEKVLFPAAGITKLDLARYYLRVAPLMLPHLRGRPVSMERYPDGIEQEGFVQKEVPAHFPGWIDRVTVPRKAGGETTYAVVERAATLVYLADQACITPHVWTSRTPRLANPDRLIFDLDPPPAAPVARVRAAARTVARALVRVGLAPHVLATGKRGFHVVAAIEPDSDFDTVRALAHDLAERLARRHPDDFTVAQRRASRGERVYIDVARNGYAQTAVPPYAVRATPRATVAVPLRPSELGQRRTRPDRFDIGNVWRRLARVGDVWAQIEARPATLDDVRRRLARAG